MTQFLILSPGTLVCPECKGRGDIPRGTTANMGCSVCGGAQIVKACPCSPEQPVRPGFKYCWDCLSIASAMPCFNEDDYRLDDYRDGGSA